MNFDKAWERVEPGIRKFLRSRLYPNELEDALQIAKVQVALACHRWNPEKNVSFFNFCLILIERRIGEAKKLRYPFSVPDRVLRNPAHPNRSFLNWRKIVYLDEKTEDGFYDEERIPSSEDSVESRVIDKTVLDDIYKAIEIGLTEDEREEFFRMVSKGNIRSKRFHSLVRKVRNEMRKLGYEIDDS
ncbi:MAG: hypothetical protein NZ822_00615 [Patescibacteria group bacterium]|nr:hypothetical protein [Patescibacteria group bacterium]